MRSKVEQFAAIRRDHRVEGLSIRALSDRHGVHRRTVRQALEAAVPPAKPRAVAPRLAPYKTAIDAMLRSDVDAPKKQRHTARRILARLVDEHGATDLSYSTVRDHVRKRRPRLMPGVSSSVNCLPDSLAAASRFGATSVAIIDSDTSMTVSGLSRASCRSWRRSRRFPSSAEPAPRRRACSPGRRR